MCVAVCVVLQGLKGAGVAHSAGASSIFILYMSTCCRVLQCVLHFKALKVQVCCIHVNVLQCVAVLQCVVVVCCSVCRR